MTDRPTSQAGERTRCADLARVFLRLGATSFGGPAAHIGLMEQELVQRRRWLTHGEFLDLLGIVNLVPGPNSTEMAILIGLRRAGWLGLLVAGISFILPSMLLVMALGWGYLRYGALPQVEHLLYGIKPVMVAIVVQALWALGRKAVKTRRLAAVGLAGAILNAWGMNPLLVLFGSGLLLAWGAGGRPRPAQAGLPMMLPLPLAAAAIPAGTAIPFSLWGLFLFFLKVGSILFGSGYVLLAFLRADLVERWGWLTETQLLDAIAVGQVTPGPVSTAATFIGYLLGGPVAAVAATVGIFLPAFVIVALAGSLTRRLRESRVAGAFLDGVNVASLALMAVVTFQLGRAAMVDGVTVGLALLAMLLLFRYKPNSVWLVLGGALAGWLAFAWGTG